MNPQILNEIIVMVQEDLATSRQLLSLLEEESSATQTLNYTIMSKCLRDKAPLLEKLQQNANKRSKWLISHNQQPNETAWLAYINTSGNLDLQKEWNKLKITLEHCQSINTTNGKLVNRGLNSHSRLLKIIRGNVSQADLYNAKGNKLSTNLSGKVAQA